jgi:hypothetical protein
MTSQAFLESIGACKEGREKVGTRKLKDSFADSVRGDWLIWVLARCAGQPQWPSRSAVLAVATHWLAQFGHPELRDQLPDGLVVLEPAIFADKVAKLLIHAAQSNDTALNLKRLADGIRATFQWPVIEALD